AERRRARDLADRLLRLEALRDEGPAGTAPRRPASQVAPLSPAPAGDAMPRAGPQSGAVVADSVATLLDAQTALVEFVTGAYGAPTTVFVITRSLDPSGGPASIRAYTAPSADSLAPRIGRFLALLEGGGDAPQVGASIAAATIDSALELAGPRVTHLIIAPDGPLHRVPFDAIRLRSGAPLA